MSARFSNGTLKALSISEIGTNIQPRSKKPLIILGILLGIFIVSTAVLAVMFAMKGKTTNIDNELCVSPYCVKAANYLLESMDETVEPCEDFYNFVCGTWIKNNRIPDDADSISTFNSLRTQLDYNVVDLLTPKPGDILDEPKSIINARILYQSCINEVDIEEEGIETIRSVIDNELGGWPILQGSSWDNSTFNLFNLLLKLREYNNNILFGIGTSTDNRNSQQYDIEIGQGDLGLGQPHYYSNETKFTVAYRQFMFDLAMALSDDISMMEQDVNDIFEFEQEIAKHYWTVDDRRTRPNATFRTTMGNLSQLLTTGFDFTQYIRSAYTWADINIVDDDIVHVSESDYLNNVSLIIDRTPSRTLQNYVVWRFMMRRVDNMPKRFRSIYENFEHVFRGTTTEQPRTVICGHFVNGNMGFAVSKLYIKKYFDENARIQSMEMISNIRKAFIDMLSRSTWMDEISRDKAIEKAEAIDEKIGYPDYLGSDDVTQLENVYAEYIFSSSYINNVLQLLRIKAKEDFRLLRQQVDRKGWGFSAPTVVNAFYTPSKNQITFPAGILQMPFFDRDAPKYLNYGGIGIAIGHEMTHGFDNNGRKFDKDGNQIPWWTYTTVEQFNNRAACIINQYSNYTVPGISVKPNGKQTQGEDIADNGGLRESFFAYQKWVKANPNADKKLPGLSKYSSEQMFFINYAHTWCSKMTDAAIINRLGSDVHSLGQFRVLGPTSNFDEFDRVFQCRPGQANSRVNKCIVW